MASQTRQTIQYPVTHYSMVKQFHYMFDHPISETKLTEIDPVLKDFRYKLINEEYNEFLDAFKDKDFGEMADALCDISYVTNGAAICFGIDLVEELRKLDIDISTPKDFSNSVFLMIFKYSNDELQDRIDKLNCSIQYF